MDAIRYALQPMIRTRGAGFLEYYAKELEADRQAAAERNFDPHHVVETCGNGAKPRDEPLLVRARREGALIKEI